MKRRSETVLGLATAVILVACNGSASQSGAPETSAPTVPAAPKSVDVDPAAALEVRAEEVSFQVGGRTISGTITIPAGNGKHAAVLLLAGSGPTDRNWTNPLIPGKNGSGKLLAEALTKRGAVVLRFDKMGTGKTPPPKTVTWGGFLDEAKGALAVLRSRSEVDPARIVIAGHSEGGLHATRLGESEGAKVRGVMLLSSVGRNYGELMVSQIEASFRTEGGLSGDALANVMKPIKKALSDFAAGKPVDPKSVGPFPAIQRLVAGLVNPASVGLVRPLLAFDPAAAVARLKVPVLVYGGAKDIQVDPKIDGVLLRDAAKKGGVDVTYYVGVDADHVIKHEPRLIPVLLADRGATGRGYNKDGRVLDADSLKAMVTWLAKHTRATANPAK